MTMLMMSMVEGIGEGREGATHLYDAVAAHRSHTSHSLRILYADVFRSRALVVLFEDE